MIKEGEYSEERLLIRTRCEGGKGVGEGEKLDSEVFHVKLVYLSD